MLGADQVLVCDGGCTTSPKTAPPRAPSSPALRGRRHELLSAAVVFEAGRPVWRHVGRAHADDAAVQRRLPRRLSRRARATRSSPRVGGYRLEDGGAQLFSRVDGDLFTIVGLPLLELLGFLRTPRDRRGMTASPRLAGVIGWPIGHSRSPRLHGHWLRRYRIDGYYIPIAPAAGRLRGRPARAARRSGSAA